MEIVVVENRLLQIAKDFSKIAKGTVTVEEQEGALIAHGEEIAVLRLLCAFQFNENARVEYSESLDTWRFVLGK